MAGKFYIAVRSVSALVLLVLCSLAPGLLWAHGAADTVQSISGSELPMTPAPRTAIDLKDIRCKIVYETFRNTDGKANWELCLINADGSNPVNLTNTPDSDEMYPHASPDGTKICCVADEMVRGRKVRNVYCMNVDGTGRVKVADNARQP
ncbi:MAG: TolB family protein, partial [Planctomycetota bacterium]